MPLVWIRVRRRWVKWWTEFVSRSYRSAAETSWSCHGSCQGSLVARNGPAITVAGGRDTENEFRLDGTAQKNLTHNSALNLPSPDALQEFKVLTSNYSAEYGR